jgi:Tol biopolymer transport system component
MVDLETGARHVVVEEASFARYVPAAPPAATGHVVFVRNGALMAAPFDAARPDRTGTPVTIVDGVRAAQFDVSPSGVLAYMPGSGAAPDFSLVWVDRAGVASPINDQPRGYEDLHLSPDGRRVALTIEERGPDTPAHVWLADTERGTVTRFTFDGLSRDPVWAPDGRSIVFGSKRGEAFGLYLQRLDGRADAERVWMSPIPIWPDPQSWTPDGRTVVFTTKGEETSDDIWTLSLADGTARPWLQTPATEWAGRLSPDGRWMAYNSNESGRDDVYVQPYPGPGAKHLVSATGGFNPIWSRDGRELFYRRADEFYAVEVETEPTFTVGTPVLLFSGRYRATGRDYDVSPDGRRFVLMRNDDPRTMGTLRVVLNWWQLAGARLGGGR